MKIIGIRDDEKKGREMLQFSVVLLEHKTKKNERHIAVNVKSTFDVEMSLSGTALRQVT